MCSEQLQEWAKKNGATWHEEHGYASLFPLTIRITEDGYRLYYLFEQLTRNSVTLKQIDQILDLLGYELDPLADATGWPGNTEQYPKQYFVTKLRNVISTNIAGNTLSEIQAHAEALLCGVEYQRRKARQRVS